MNKRNVKLTGTIVGILLFVALIAGVTYAWISWQSGNTTISGKSKCFTINYTAGQSLSTNNILLFDEDFIIEYDSELETDTILVKEGMALLNITAQLDSGCTDILADLIVSLDVKTLNENFISGDSVGAFKYVLASYDPNTYSQLSELKGERLEILQKNSITNTGEITYDAESITHDNKGYLLIFYIDGDMAFNGVANSTFSATINGTAKQYGY